MALSWIGLLLFCLTRSKLRARYKEHVSVVRQAPVAFVSVCPFLCVLSCSVRFKACPLSCTCRTCITVSYVYPLLRVAGRYVCSLHTTTDDDALSLNAPVPWRSAMYDQLVPENDVAQRQKMNRYYFQRSKLADALGH